VFNRADSQPVFASFFVMLKTSYHPIHSENRMQHEGDTSRARNYFLNDAPANLKLLVERRYSWMNRHIRPDDMGLEIGCGTGMSRHFIRSTKYFLSDVADYDWLDYCNVNALDTPFADAQFDFVVSSNMVHHVAHPLVLFREMERILKPGGRLLIQEINGSLAMRALLHLMRHEGYSYNVNVFDENCVCNDPEDPWSANCVIPNLLWDDRARFEREVPAFRITHHGYSEFSTLINSGGVIAKTTCIPLPRWVVRAMQGVDTALATVLPSVFALQRQIVLVKNGPVMRSATGNDAAQPLMKRGEAPPRTVVCAA
jgi:SAM-dependent methyltransferase